MSCSERQQNLPGRCACHQAWVYKCTFVVHQLAGKGLICCMCNHSHDSSQSVRGYETQVAPKICVSACANAYVPAAHLHGCGLQCYIDLNLYILSNCHHLAMFFHTLPVAAVMSWLFDWESNLPCTQTLPGRYQLRFAETSILSLPEVAPCVECIKEPS